MNLLINQSLKNYCSKHKGIIDQGILQSKRWSSNSLKGHQLLNDSRRSVYSLAASIGGVSSTATASIPLLFQVSNYSTTKPCFQSRKPPIPPPNTKQKIAGSIGAAASTAFLLGSKSKSILAALQLTKFASFGSMFLTVGAYSTIYGLPYASGMVGLILIHESGHALTMRHYGIPFSPMIFVPFLGASVAMKQTPKSAYQEAWIAMGGPALGTLGSYAVWGGGYMTDSQLLYALADFGFMINLFNMIPIGMLDGGRIGNAISPYTGLVGVGIAGSMIGLGHVSNPIFYLITLAGGYQTGMRLWNKGKNDSSLPRNYYGITDQQRLQIAGGYFGLLGVLFGGMALNENYKKSPERLRFEQRVGDGGLVNVYRD